MPTEMQEIVKRVAIEFATKAMLDHISEQGDDNPEEAVKVFLDALDDFKTRYRPAFETQIKKAKEDSGLHWAR